MQLYNKLSALERSTILEESGSERLTLSFYKYAHIGNPELFRDHLFLSWDSLEVLGRIYVAHEGINAQLSLPVIYFKEFKNHLESISFLKDVKLNIAVKQNLKSFLKLTIKVRDKIVADGLEDKEFDVTNKGIHVNALKFNQLLKDKNTICVDMRNHYESEIGHFQNAIKPDVDTFRESLPIIEKDLSKYKEDKNLLMYCTGGIRCEKSTSYLLEKGFEEVYHLKGGVLNYFEQVPHTESTWEGECFVFDNRVTVNHQLEPGEFDQCHACRRPITDEDKRRSEFVVGVQCHHCVDEYSDAQRERFLMRQQQIELAESRGERHVGIDVQAFEKRQMDARRERHLKRVTQRAI